MDRDQRNTAQSESQSRHCVICDESFPARRGKLKTCLKKECRQELQRRNQIEYRAKRLGPKFCVVCGEEYPRRKGMTKTCLKPECRKELDRRTDAANYRRNIHKKKAQQKISRARRKARTWRPADWLDRPIEWRIIGTELLSRHEYVSNQELAKILDAAEMIKCRYGPTWFAAIGKEECKKFIGRIRTWVKRPGKNPAVKDVRASA